MYRKAPDSEETERTANLLGHHIGIISRQKT